MTRQFRKIAGLAGMTALALALAACGGGSGSASSSSSGSAGAPASGGTFTLALGSDPGTVNPYKSTGGLNRQVYAFAYDTLVGRGTDGKPVPQLSSSWTTTNTSVTYTIKTGVTCSDGTALKPSDIAADFNYICLLYTSDAADE